MSFQVIIEKRIGRRKMKFRYNTTNNLSDVTVSCRDTFIVTGGYIADSEGIAVEEFADGGIYSFIEFYEGIMYYYII